MAWWPLVVHLFCPPQRFGRKNWLLGSLTLLIFSFALGNGFSQENPVGCLPAKVFFDVGCENLNVRFKGVSTWPVYYWRVGGVPPVITTQQNELIRPYSDVSPYQAPILIEISSDQVAWCGTTFSFPATYVGDGCGSTRKISQLIQNGVIPPNGMINQEIYVFGNLEVDQPYDFTSCRMYFGGGGKLIVKSELSLDGTTLDVNSNCTYLWSGIEVYPGAWLRSSFCTITNAVNGIRNVVLSGQSAPANFNITRTTFEKNFVGMHLSDGKCNIESFNNNVFRGPLTVNLPGINTDCAVLQPTGITYSQKPYAGIYIKDVPGTVFLDGINLGNNYFSELQAGIVCLSTNLTLGMAVFENIGDVPGLLNNYRGTAVSFVNEKNLGRHFNFKGLGKDYPAATIDNCSRGIYVSGRRGATVDGKSRKTDKTCNKDTSQELGRRKTSTKPICL